MNRSLVLIAPSLLVACGAREIVTLPAGTTKHLLVVFGSAAPEAAFDPTPVSPDTFNQLASTTNAANLTRSERHTQFNGLVRTENPRRTTPETVSCASCHFAMTAKKRIAEPQFGLLDSASTDVFQLDPMLVPAIDLSPTFGGPEFEINVHAFSYNGTDAAIVQRVVNDSAATVEYFVAAPVP